MFETGGGAGQSAARGARRYVVSPNRKHLHFADSFLGMSQVTVEIDMFFFFLYLKCMVYVTLLMINVSVVSDYIWVSYYIIIINCSKPGNSFLALNSI